MANPPDFELSDANLLERFAFGREEAAFSTLMNRHRPGVRAACRRILRSEHDAEDVVQATFLVLAMRAGEVPWRDSVGGWLRGVARRLALHSRRDRRERFLDDGAAEPPQPGSDPLIEAARRDLRRLIDEELERLPAGDRETVRLCDLEGLSHAEAARRLGVPSGSISRRLERSRAILRTRLKGRGVVPAVLVLVCAAVLMIRGRGPSVDLDPVTVRAAMAPLKPIAGGRHDLAALLGRIDAGRTTSREEVLGLEHAARSLGAIDPGRDRETWRLEADRLRQAAREMAEAADLEDYPSLRNAARRADASCIRCHLAFRQ